MKKERKMLRVADLQLNEGQLGWLPKNPRQWTQEDIERMRASIREDPDFIEDRPALVTPCDGGFCVFAHNLYTHAASQEGIDVIPCVIYTPESEEDQQTIIRRAMKDNGSFGAWDWDALANEWDDLPLGDWGVPAWKTPTGDDETPKEGGAGDGGNYNYSQQYAVIVTCKDEAEQQQVYNRLTEEGYECKVVQV